MKKFWCGGMSCLCLIVLILVLGGCGGSTNRYDPGTPAVTTGLTATPGNGQVALSWNAAANAAGYVVYYSTSAGVTKSTGTKFATTTSTSAIVTGLTNGIPYYFTVTSINSNSESAESNQVAASPSSARSFSQADLAGTWNFNILVSGTGSKWMRGALTVDATGVTTMTSFSDSTGAITAPTGLLSALYVDAVGQVQDVASGTPTFKGVLAANQYKDLIIGTAPGNTTSPMIAILQKQVSTVTFSDTGDLAGFSSGGGGARRFVYNQISTGTPQEWEYAVGQIGSDRKVQYSTLTAPSSPTTPGAKATIMTINATTGIVTETLTGVTPQPAILMDRGVMSADKSIIVGTATSGSKYVLRIYQVINKVTSDTNSFALSNLAGSYNASQFTVGSSLVTAYAAVQFDSAGAALFTSYLNNSDSTTGPSGFSALLATSTGVLTNSSDATFHGKLAYYKDLVVFTRTASSGVYDLFVGVK